MILEISDSCKQVNSWFLDIISFLSVLSKLDKLIIQQFLPYIFSVSYDLHSCVYFRNASVNILFMCKHIQVFSSRHFLSIPNLSGTPKIRWKERSFDEAPFSYYIDEKNAHTGV